MMAGILYLENTLGWMHPFPVPAILFIFIFLPAIGLLVFKGFLKLLFWRKRLQTAGWLLTGLSPFLICASIGMYSEHINSYQYAIPNPTLITILSSGYASGNNLERLIYYPIRFEGEKVIMFTDWKDWNKGAEQNVQKADKFIKSIEKKLNRKCKNKAYWVRKQDRVYADSNHFSGLVIGTEPENLIEQNSFELHYTDLFGLASFVIRDIVGPNVQPPKLLSRGWVSLNYNDPGIWYEHLTQQRKHGLSVSLQEMVQKENYHSSNFNIPTTGGVLCEYLLEKYDSEKFLELYSTCTPDTFLFDFKRIYGVSFKGFEKKFWEDFDKKVSSRDHLKKQHYLYSAKIAQGIDINDLYHVFDNHIKGYNNLLNSRDQSHTITDIIDPDSLDNDKEHYETIFYGEYLKSFAFTEDDSEEVMVYSPEKSFLISKYPDDSQWKIEHIDDYSNNKKQNQFKAKLNVLWDMISNENLAGHLYMDGEALTEIFDYDWTMNKSLNWTITNLENIKKGNNDYWKITGKFIKKGHPAKLSITFDPQNNWAINELNNEYR